MESYIKIFFTISNNSRTSFSDSPLYFDVNVEDETLKNVVPHSVATAFASIVLPVPGGPTISTPFQGRLIPFKKRKNSDICINATRSLFQQLRNSKRRNIP